MKKEGALLVFGLLLATVRPVEADVVIGRKTMERRFDRSGVCHLPYREYQLDGTFGPIQTPLYFTATGTTATVSIEAMNPPPDPAWGSLHNVIDNFVVVKRSVFEDDVGWKKIDGGCNGAYFDFNTPGADPVFLELFTQGWGSFTGVGTGGVYWEDWPFTAGNKALALGHPNDPPRILTSVTVDNLVPGEEYAISFWWYVSVPDGGDTARPTLKVTIPNTSQLFDRAPRNDSLAGDLSGASWDYFYVEIPAGTASLTVDLYGLSGDADLYLRRGARPDAGTYDCASFAGGTTSDQCLIAQPTLGRWWIGVRSFDPGQIDYAVEASWEKPDLDFYTVSPCRVTDTRLTPGLPLGSGFGDLIVIAGYCGVPLTAKAVSLNLTITDPTGFGHLQLWPGNTPKPPVSTLNFVPGIVRANNAILRLAPDGFGDIAVEPSVTDNGTVHLIVDVNGYFQ